MIQLANRICQFDFDTLDDRAEKKIYSYFRMLRPLRTSRITSLETESYQIRIGIWVSIRRHTDMRSRPIFDPFLFRLFIAGHGKEISEYVRKPIKNIFKRLTTLSGYISYPYYAFKKKVNITVKIPVRYDIVKLEEVDVREILLHSSTLTLNGADEISIPLSEYKEIMNFLYVNPHLIMPIEELIKEAEEEEYLKSTMETNNAAISEMDKLILPFKLVNL